MSDEDFDPQQFMKDKDEMMRIVQKKMAEQDFDSPEAADRWLQDFMSDRTIDDIIAEESSAPETPEERALVELQGMDGWDDDPALVAKAANRALKIDPRCIEAHTYLGNSAREIEDAVPHYVAALEAGRERWGDLIQSCRGKGPEEQGLWGFLEARPFMVAMQSLGDCYYALGDLKKATALAEEMLEINAGDNQGIRERLLTLYLAQERNADARSLLGRYGENGLSFSFTPILLDFIDLLNSLPSSRIRALEKLEARFLGGDTLSDGLRHAEEFIEVLGRKGAVLFERLENLLRSSPWAPMILSSEERLNEFPTPRMLLFEGPFEMVEYATGAGVLWVAVPLAYPFLACASLRVTEGSPEEIKKAIERNEQELAMGEDFLGETLFEREGRPPLPGGGATLLGGPTGVPAPQTIVAEEKIGRNQACPCGSGKKYKKCCGAST